MLAVDDRCSLSIKALVKLTSFVCDHLGEICKVRVGKRALTLLDLLYDAE